jgi:hypothetical protein
MEADTGIAPRDHDGAPAQVGELGRFPCHS